ncbi:ParB/RepB/Spo0J family partition protein [Acinetobacter radioresistens]|uniref:ParB/RepB/Spo0J family partition protein n=1 Tax=Acinetobacter radioresistens TaxID=40216 RepID=UPI0020065B29|nr:ParB/RepB/Spo0J family partition protein [Acinetobacter radioresistens]MCK4083732.1 ParB/RepB/Spo0J family partition protein [Acinetobacter radioresistens]
MNSSKSLLAEALNGMGIDSTNPPSTKEKIETSSHQESLVEIKLEQIAIAPQVRKRIADVNDLVESIGKKGLNQKCVVRHFLNDDEKAELTKIYPKAKYVLVVGHRRMTAMNILGMKSENFLLKPKGYYKDIWQVLEDQLDENENRENMSIYDHANSMFLAHQTKPEATFEEIGLAFKYSKTVVSKYIRIATYIHEEAEKTLNSWGVTSVNSLYHIAKFIKDGLDWKSLLKQYAVDKEGNFDPSKITDKLVTQIKDDIENPKPEPTEVPPVEAAVDIDPLIVNGVQDQQPTDQAPVNTIPASSDPVEEVEKQDTSASRGEPSTTNVPASANLVSQPATNAKAEPSDNTKSEPVETHKTEPTTAQPVIASNKADFLKGIAFVLGQDPDCDAKAIANILNNSESGFELDAHCQSIYDELIELVE